MQIARCDETCAELHEQVDRLEIIRPEVQMIMHLMVHTGGVGTDRVGCQWSLCPYDRAQFGPPKTTLGPSIDHIVHRSFGGSNRPDNLRLMHFSCNIRSGQEAAEAGRAAWRSSSDGQDHVRRLSKAGHQGRTKRAAIKRRGLAERVLAVLLAAPDEYVSSQDIALRAKLTIKETHIGRHYLRTVLAPERRLRYEFKPGRGNGFRVVCEPRKDVMISDDVPAST